jgi:hypothetical protein
MAHICGCQGSSCLTQALAVRLFALAIGLGRDVTRRYTFMQKHQQQQTA